MLLKRAIHIMALCFVAGGMEISASPLQKIADDEFMLPSAALACVRQQPAEYEISTRMNPFYLRGDFDGDGRMDYAILLREKHSAKEGVLVCESATRRSMLIGAGKRVILQGTHSTDDLVDFNVWMVKERGSVAGIRSQGEFLYLEKRESGSGVFYRKGGKYLWLQLGE